MKLKVFFSLLELQTKNKYFFDQSLTFEVVLLTANSQNYCYIVCFNYICFHLLDILPTCQVIKHPKTSSMSFNFCYVLLISIITEEVRS